MLFCLFIPSDLNVLARQLQRNSEGYLTTYNMCPRASWLRLTNKVRHFVKKIFKLSKRSP